MLNNSLFQDNAVTLVTLQPDYMAWLGTRDHKKYSRETDYIESLDYSLKELDLNIIIIISRGIDTVYSIHDKRDVSKIYYETNQKIELNSFIKGIHFCKKQLTRGSNNHG